MKSKLFAVLCLCIFLVPQAHSQNEPIWGKIKSYDNPVYGTLTDKKLKKDAWIMSYPVRKGKVSIYANDALQSFTLFKDFHVKAVMVPKGSWVQLYHNGYPEFITLKADTEVNGMKAGCKPKVLHWHLSFYNDGSLASFYPVEDILIDGLPCKKQTGVDFYPDGKLWMCHLAKDFIHNSKVFPAGTHIIRNKEGQLMEYSKNLYLQLQDRYNVKPLKARFYKE